MQLGLNSMKRDNYMNTSTSYILPPLPSTTFQEIWLDTDSGEPIFFPDRLFSMFSHKA